MKRSKLQLPPEVARRLGPYYVYVLIDPKTGSPFYVGKGTGERLLAHGLEADLRSEAGQSRKIDRIRLIRASGLEPRIDVVRHGIATEAEAFLVEAALIDCLPDLTNAVAGHGTALSRAPLPELVSRYGADPLTVTDPPVLMIRLTPRWIAMPEEIEPGYHRAGHGWRADLTPLELFDAVRAWWKVNPQRIERRGINHVVGVCEGVTRGIYRIEGWTRRADGRWAFSGSDILTGDAWDAYVGQLGKRVPFTSNSQNPLVYWPLSATPP